MKSPCNQLSKWPLSDAKSVSRRWLIATAMLLATAGASGAANLKLGDILVIEPGTSSVAVVDATTGNKTVISSGNLLAPANKAVGVALAADGDVIVVHRLTGLIRVNPLTGQQSILSQGGLFRDPWAITIDKDTGDIYVVDSGYDNDRTEINEAGKVIRVNPVTGAQTLIASGSACTVFPSNVACQNTTSAGSYISHPYGIAIDYTTSPKTLVVADMSSFAGKGAIVRLQATPGGTQTLLWGPSSAVPAPQVAQVSPLGCPMGVAVEPNGNILTTVFTYPVPSTPTFPPPAGTFYGCTPPGIYRINLASHTQTVLNANAPAWQPNRAYAVGAVIRDTTSSLGRVHRVVTAGVSQSPNAPSWNATQGGSTVDGSVVWQNIGPGSNWLIPFGIETEPIPSNPSQYNVIVGDEGHSSLFRLSSTGAIADEGDPIAIQLGNVTSVDVISFTPVGGFKTEPLRSNGQPTGTLPSGTSQATLSLTTDVNATCRYATVAGVAYPSMTNTFTTTGSTSHSRVVTGLANGSTYNFYVRCQDAVGHANSDDFVITFSIGQAPSSTPVASFSFDEGTGSTLNDNSGHGNAGVISGATWTQGKFGNALLFDGANDFVSVADSATLDVTNGLTLEAWVYPTANGGGTWRNVVMKERSGGEVYNLYSNTDTNTPVVYVVAEDSPEAPADARGTNQLPINTWSHLAAIFDGSNLRLYVNGSLADTRSVNDVLLTSTGALRIGGNSIWGEYFQGRIDEIRIYNRALSAIELLIDMNTAINGSFTDTVPPARTNGQPSGLLAFGTTQATLSLVTGENATCRYSTQAGVAYSSMTNTFTTTGGTTHSRVVTGLTNGTSYTFNVRCIDTAGNANPDDFPITFSVASSIGGVSNFSGAENPLSEGGQWDSPGSWSDLQKNNGAFTGGLNAAARFVTPAIAADQYSQITYDQNPGASSWAGVMTRIQGAGNGSGYLAIAYSGQVQLYRAADAGSLGFTQLATANADLSASPRRLRLESQGNTHRVFFNGTLLITYVDSAATYVAGQPGIAASVFGGPQVKILSFEGGNFGTGSDSTPPVRLNGQPTGALPFGTTQATLSLTTDENATCRYMTTAGVAYASMTNTFTTTGSTGHSRVVTGLTNGTNYTFYVRCIDALGNANTTDFPITFSVSSSAGGSSTFSGTENPLSENGTWDSAGNWADFQKNNGAFATGLNAGGRFLGGGVTSDQYSEITYDQNPGASSWAGTMTRVQGASNGSGYLAIVYAGEVRLYRTDDSGGLNFTLLASAPADLSAAPRRLRLESQGNSHRVYFNGALVITHNATGTIYSGGSPGIAASVFGGPQMKILSFTGGSLGT